MDQVEGFRDCDLFTFEKWIKNSNHRILIEESRPKNKKEKRLLGRTEINQSSINDSFSKTRGGGKKFFFNFFSFICYSLGIWC